MPKPMTRVYGDIRHAIGFNHIGQECVPFCVCGWLGEPSTSGVAQTAGEVHLGES